ncbi:MAG: hypothetical protein AAB447_03715 [Patescibacteria group bacterium]
MAGKSLSKMVRSTQPHPSTKQTGVGVMVGMRSASLGSHSPPFPWRGSVIGPAASETVPVMGT